MILTACRVCRLWKHFMWLFCNFWHVHKHTQIAYTAESDLNLSSIIACPKIIKLIIALMEILCAKRSTFMQFFALNFENTNTSCFTWKILESLSKRMVHTLRHLPKNGFKETNHTLTAICKVYQCYSQVSPELKRIWTSRPIFDMYVRIFNRKNGLL